MADVLKRLHEDVSVKLSEIAGLFMKPEEVKITIIIRTPWLADGGVVLSNDTDEEAMAEFNRLKNSKSTTVTG